MDAFARRRQQPGDRILGQPVDLQVGPQFAQFAGDRDVAPAMAEPDRRGEVEGLARPALPRPARRTGSGDADATVEEIDDQRVRPGGKCRVGGRRRRWSPARAGDRGYGLGPAGAGCDRRRRDQQQRAGDGVHRLPVSKAGGIAR
jgi:hypothetical protein